MECAGLAGDARPIDRRLCGAVGAADAFVVLHRCGAIAQQRQQVRERFLHRKPRLFLAARILQHLEGAAIVPHRFFSGIHHVGGVASRDQRAGGSGGIGQAAGAVQMMRDPGGVDAGLAVEPRHRVGDAQVEPLPPQLRNRAGQRLAGQLVRKAPRDVATSRGAFAGFGPAPPHPAP